MNVRSFLMIPFCFALCGPFIFSMEEASPEIEVSMKYFHVPCDAEFWPMSNGESNEVERPIHHDPEENLGRVTGLYEPTPQQILALANHRKPENVKLVRVVRASQKSQKKYEQEKLKRQFKKSKRNKKGGGMRKKGFNSGK